MDVDPSLVVAVARFLACLLRLLGPVQVGPLHRQQRGGDLDERALVSLGAQVPAVVLGGGQVLKPLHRFAGEAPFPERLLKQALFAAQSQVQEPHQFTGSVEVGGFGDGQAEQYRPVPQEQVVLVEIDVEGLPVQGPIGHPGDEWVGDHLLPDGPNPGPEFVA